MKLLYSLIFIFFLNSSLFAECEGTIWGSPVTYEYFNVSTYSTNSFSEDYTPCTSYHTEYKSNFRYQGDGEYLCDLKIINYTNVDSCPDGLLPDDKGVCSEPPPPDFDGDGTSDSEDPDIDGDGIPNEQDSDDDNDGIPDSYDDYIGAGTSNGPLGSGGGTSDGGPDESSCDDLYNKYTQDCLSSGGLSLSFGCQTTSTGFAYITQNKCNMPSNPCEDIVSDFVASCKSPSVVNGGCTYNEDTNRVSNTLSCTSPSPVESACDIAIKNFDLTCKAPSYLIGRCNDLDGAIISNTLECYTPPENLDENGTVISDDMSNKAQTDALINNNNLNTDKLVNHLQKIEDSSNSSVDTLKSIDSKLNTMLNRDNDNIELNSIDTKLGFTNNKLDSTNAKLDEVNTNLTNMNNSINEIKNTQVSLDSEEEVNIDTTSLDETSSYMDNLEDNLAYLTDDITSIKEQYENLKI